MANNFEKNGIRPRNNPAFAPSFGAPIEDLVVTLWGSGRGLALCVGELGVAIGKNVIFRLQSLLLRAVFSFFAAKLLARGSGLSA